MNNNLAAEKPPPAHAYPHPVYAWYVVILLSIANALSFVARTILALLVDPVKADLQVSDTAISMLHGFSFALIFAVIGLPISWLADRGSRRTIIAVSIFFWSASTAACGLARSYLVLFMGRLGAGAGEGGFSPPSFSIITDYFPKHKLPLAMAVQSVGIYVGIGLALMIGGWVTQWAISLGVVDLPFIGIVKGWQVAFFMVGLPGIGLALLFYVTVREPVRQGMITAPVAPRASLQQLRTQYARHRRAYNALIVGFSLHVLVGYGASAWTPAFMGRHFGMTPSQIGFQYGLVTLIFGLVGAALGGIIAGRLRRNGVTNANAWVGLVGYGIEMLFGIAFFAANSSGSTLLCAAIMNIGSAAAMACGFAAIQEITPNRLRAQMAAVFLFAINLVGTGVGPTAVALLAEHVFSGTQALAQGIALTSLVAGPLATWFLWQAVRHYPRDIDEGTEVTSLHA